MVTSLPEIGIASDCRWTNARTKMGKPVTGCGLNKSCRTYGCSEADGNKLLKCADCKSTYYCSETCQRADWRTHKAPCKAQMESNREMKQSGVKPGKLKMLSSWYTSHRDVASDAKALAWKHREENPVIRVVGSHDGNVAGVAVILREMWEVFEGGILSHYISLFSESTFDKGKHFIVSLEANHPGTEDWPCSNVRMSFNQNHEILDKFANAESLKRSRDSSMLRLKGLKSNVYHHALSRVAG